MAIRHLAIPLRNGLCRCGESVDDPRYHFTVEEYDQLIDGGKLVTAKSMTGTEWEVLRGQHRSLQL